MHLIFPSGLRTSEQARAFLKVFLFKTEKHTKSEYAVSPSSQHPLDCCFSRRIHIFYVLYFHVEQCRLFFFSFLSSSWQQLWSGLCYGLVRSSSSDIPEDGA